MQPEGRHQCTFVDFIGCAPHPCNKLTPRYIDREQRGWHNRVKRSRTFLCTFSVSYSMSENYLNSIFLMIISVWRSCSRNLSGANKPNHRQMIIVSGSCRLRPARPNCLGSSRSQIPNDNCQWWLMRSPTRKA